MNLPPTPKKEHLFQFDFAPVETIKPWGHGDDTGLSLSLYALTYGHFRISAGKETLLQYTPEIISLWGLHHELADYQVACFALDVFMLVAAVLTPIPTFFESIVRDDDLFRHLRKHPTKSSYGKVPCGVVKELEIAKTSKDFEQDHYNAFRWLGERSIWLNYLTAGPDIWFVRVGNEVWVQWDNIHRKFEGINVWTARHGTNAISAQAFLIECQGLSERLLSAMESRIVSIENGFARPQIPLDTTSLRKQLLEYKKEFEGDLSAKYEPDIDWVEAEMAMRSIALQSGVSLPPV